MKNYKLGLYLVLCGFCFFVAGCASKPKETTQIKEQSVEELYNKAFYDLEKTKYKQAAKLFEQVEMEFPYSKWATQAKLMSAYAYYKGKEYDDAIMSLDRFLRFHPGNSSVSYAYYLKAMCYYDQIANIDRGQGDTIMALDAMEQLILRYPNSDYAKDVEQKIVFATENLAGKEMEVGRYYLNINNYLSALNRFSEVINNYQQTKYIEEALYRQVEIFAILGMQKEAQSAYEVLEFNYPQSSWTISAQLVIKG